MIKLIVNFKVNEQHIEKKDNVYLVNKTKNYLKFCFTFNETWDDYEKYILFHSKEKNYEFILPYDDEMECYGITVPNKVLLGKHFRFSLYGIQIIDEDETRITTNDFRVRLDHSGYTQNIIPIDDDTGIDDVFANIKMLIGEKFDDLLFVEDKVLCISNGEIKKIVPLSFLEEYYTKDESDSLLSNKANLIHNHVTNDVVDFEENVDNDLDIFLTSLTESIRQL